MIKGLADRNRLPRVGKIRLGEKALSKRTNNEYPVAVDYFVVKADDGITTEAAAAAFRQVYGDKPREIDILFPVNEVEIAAATWYKSYKESVGLFCKGDGETAQRVMENGGMDEIECNPAECPIYQAKHCKQLMNLQFLLPKVPGLGVWQLDTTSWNSMRNILGGIDFIRAITGGRFAMIPLKLRVVPMEVSPDGKKKIVHVLTLQHDEMSLGQVLLASQQSPQQFLLPTIDEQKAPEDLYPRSLLEGRVQPGQTTQAPTQAVEAEVVDDEPEEPDVDPELVHKQRLIRHNLERIGTLPAKIEAFLRTAEQGDLWDDLLGRVQAELRQRGLEMEDPDPPEPGPGEPADDDPFEDIGNWAGDDDNFNPDAVNWGDKKAKPTPAPAPKPAAAKAAPKTKPGNGRPAQQAIF